jgi:hypothetical protein
MSTRKLILAALVCGLAILLAGGILLFRLASTGDVSEQVIADVGDVVSVGTASAAVESWSLDGSVVTLMVAVTGGEGGVDDQQAAWSLIDARGLVPRTVPASAPECPASPLGFGEEARCTVAFDLGERASSGLTAFFRVGGRSSGWSLSEP